MECDRSVCYSVTQLPLPHQDHGVQFYGASEVWNSGHLHTTVRHHPPTDIREEKVIPDGSHMESVEVQGYLNNLWAEESPHPKDVPMQVDHIDHNHSQVAKMHTMDLALRKGWSEARMDLETQSLVHLEVVGQEACCHCSDVLSWCCDSHV